MIRTIISFVLVTIISILVVGCAPQPSSENPAYLDGPPSPSDSLKTQDGEVTSYISIDLAGMPDKHDQVIEKAFQDWQTANPDREIVDFQIIFQPYSHGPSRTYGIYILSQPKE